MHLHTGHAPASRRLAFVLGIAGALACAAPRAVAPVYASNVAAAATAVAPVAPAGRAAIAPITGGVDSPAAESVVGTAFTARGWALAARGIRRVEIRVDGRPYPAQYGLARPDVAARMPGYPDSARAGFTFEANFPDLSLDRHVVEIVAIAQDGTTSRLASRSLIPPPALALWTGRLDAQPALARESFYFLMMTSGVTAGGAREVDTQYQNYPSRTQKVGISVPILYLRTTRGAAGDWVFDPGFDTTRRCGKRQVAEDNLDGVIRYAIANRLPVQFILNGGIWADASCATPQWDLTDHLEQDVANCQWTQGNQVFPDDYLKGLNGSTESPELARSLTYHVYAARVRRYKKRNLQAAGRAVAAFAHAHPDLFVGVVLDADTYMNPFFRGSQSFDYNPGMLRQFREWLRVAGPYAGRPVDGAPDLSAYRRPKPMSLAEVDAVSGKRWKSWNQVEPPRHLPGIIEPVGPGERPIWDDPWWNLWDQFRKHIVDLHYDELSSWVHAAGIARERIFSAQGLIHNDPELAPFAIRVDSKSSSYDSAGVSVEGAIPRDGHLGAILYGRTARNATVMDNGRSLFATIGRMDDGWAIVEYNNTDLKFPTQQPDFAMAYQTFRDAFNFGAREISAMAWNGSNGLFSDQPGYVPYTAWRNTPAEDAMRDFLVSHADLPWGARLWTFGTPRYIDADGWTAEQGRLVPGAGAVTLHAEDGGVTLLSPPDQVLHPSRMKSLVLRFDGPVTASRVQVWARDEPAGAWHAVGAAAGPEVAFTWPRAWQNSRTIVERLKVSLAFPADAAPATLSRVLLYPSAPATRASP